MPIPIPRKKESRKHFISRCADRMATIDPDRPNNVRLAICFGAWRDYLKGKRRKKHTTKRG